MKLVGGILLAVLCATNAWADANAKANELFVEAVQLWKQAEAVKVDDLEQLETRLKLLGQVDANLDSIVADYPSSNLAVQLIIGPVGPLEAGQVDALVAEIEASLLCFRQPDVCVLGEALETARSIKGATSRAWVLGDVAKAQAGFGDVSGALETTRSIEDADGRARALVAVAKAQAGFGDVSGALETARSIEYAVLRARALVAVAIVQTGLGELETLREALETAHSIGNGYSRARALGAVAKVQAGFGAVSGALETARSIEYAVLRAEALTAVAIAQAKD